MMANGHLTIVSLYYFLSTNKPILQRLFVVTFIFGGILSRIMLKTAVNMRIMKIVCQF